MRQGGYYCLAVCSTLGMCVMASAGDLIVLYLGLELLALPYYALAALRSSDSAIKYFLLGSFALALLLFGMSLLYGLTRHTELAWIARRCLLLQAGRCPPWLLLWRSCWQAWDSRRQPRPFMSGFPTCMKVRPQTCRPLCLWRPKRPALPCLRECWSWPCRRL